MRCKGNVIMKNTKKLTLTGMLLALCVVGSMVKIMGSIALDSLPAFIGTVILGPEIGFFLGALGHLITAVLSGFPLTLPVHLITAGLMGLCMYSYGYARKKVTKRYFLNRWSSMLIAYVINVPLSLFLLYPLLGQVTYLLFIPLSIGALVNIMLAEILLSLLEKSVSKIFE